MVFFFLFWVLKLFSLSSGTVPNLLECGNQRCSKVKTTAFPCVLENPAANPKYKTFISLANPQPHHLNTHTICFWFFPQLRKTIPAFSLFFSLFLLCLGFVVYSVLRRMRMSCNGCRVLRKGCSENCSIRPCLQWIKSPESQANATVFLAKFYGRAGLMNLINAGPEHLRPG